MAYPSPNGKASERTIHRGARFEMATTSRSPRRSRLQRFGLDCAPGEEPSHVGVEETPEPTKVALIDRPR